MALGFRICGGGWFVFVVGCVRMILWLSVFGFSSFRGVPRLVWVLVPGFVSFG